MTADRSGSPGEERAESDPACRDYDSLIASRGTEAISADDDARVQAHLEVCDRCRDLSRLFDSEDDAPLDPLPGPDGLGSGATLGGRYRLDHPLGGGGMGVVWAATQVATGQAVAIKLLRDAGRDRSRRRLMREARLAASIRHPNVVRVYDVVELDDGSPALVMELLDGRSLEERFRDGPIGLGELCMVLERVAAALEAAHAAGVVHRDLKPSNVLLVSGESPSGPGAGAPTSTEVKLVDFGIAKRSEPLTGDSTEPLTTTGALVGTPFYMAPEQALGESDVDGRADLWSLGIMLYQGLSGVLPTRGDNLGRVIKAIAIAPIEPVERSVPSVPPDLAALTRRLLAKEREDRPSAGETRAILAKHTGAASPNLVRPRRARLRMPAIGAAALACAGIALAMGIRAGERANSAGDARPPVVSQAEAPRPVPLAAVDSEELPLDPAAPMPTSAQAPAPADTPVEPPHRAAPPAPLAPRAGALRSASPALTARPTGLRVEREF